MSWRYDSCVAKQSKDMITDTIILRGRSFFIDYKFDKRSSFRIARNRELRRHAIGFRVVIKDLKSENSYAKLNQE